MAANRNPYSQWHVQAEVTTYIEIIGSGGKIPGKFLKICIQLWLRMHLPAVFKHFLETKTLLPNQPLKNHSLLAFQESQRPLLDRSARPPPTKPPLPLMLLHFFTNLEGQRFEKWGVRTPHSPLGYATEIVQKEPKYIESEFDSLGFRVSLHDSSTL